MYKRLTAWLLIICFLVAVAPVSAGATAEQIVFAETVTVTAANTAYLTLRAENFVEVASFEVNVYYDPSVLSIDGTYDGYMLSGAQTSVNTDVSGEVKLVAMKLDGISGDGELRIHGGLERGAELHGIRS